MEGIKEYIAEGDILEFSEKFVVNLSKIFFD